MTVTVMMLFINVFVTVGYGPYFMHLPNVFTASVDGIVCQFSLFNKALPICIGLFWSVNEYHLEPTACTCYSGSGFSTLIFLLKNVSITVGWYSGFQICWFH